ncbi:unnamed protein product [Diabrotica balteata]|uniref:Uncharacterized protein n=1 Tax=Diabrotica balteata TaxID=107213 RepID=A0A9N9SSC6_DIABA|nr:unnamed protein product [Diabrotica balteata]
MQKLMRPKPFKNESLYDFGTRIQLRKSNVTQRISTETNLQQTDKLCQITHCDKIAPNTFIAGYTGTLKNNIHLKKPSGLEDAIAYMT